MKNWFKKLTIYERYLIFLFLLVYCFRVYLAFSLHYLSADAIQYIMLGYNLFNTGSFNTSYGVVPGWGQSPFFPFIIGFFTLIFSKRISGIICVEIILILTIIFIYRFTKKEFSREKGFLSVLLFSMNPMVFMVNGRILAESLFTLLNIVLFIYLYRLVKKEQRLKVVQIILLSLLSVLLYMTRIEGVLYLILILIILYRYSSIKQVIIFIVLYGLFIIPYGYFIKTHTGNFNLFPKITYNIRLGEVIKKNIDLYEIDINKFNTKQEISWYAYDSNSNAFYNSMIMNDEYYQSLKNENTQKIPATKSTFSILKLIAKNISESASIFINSFVFPISFFVFVLIGCMLLLKQRKDFIFFTLFWIIASFYFLLSHIEYRFFYVILPYFSIIAAHGLIYFISKVKYKNLAMVLAITIILINNSFYYYEYIMKQYKYENYYKLSKDINNIIGEGTNLCVRISQISFQGNYNYVKLPICNAQQLYNYLKINHTEYVFLGEEVFTLRKNLLNIYNNHDINFKLLKTYSINDNILKLFKAKI